MLSKIFVVKLITFYSAIYGVDSKVTLAVAEVESHMEQTAIGASHHEIGLFQIRKEFIPNYTREQLFDPIVNISVGIQRIADIKKHSKIKTRTGWLVEYNVGRTGAKKIKYPELFPYVKLINKNIAMMEL